MYTIVKGLHILFKGANGKHTVGIRVRKNYEEAGYQREFNINEYDILNKDIGYFLDMPEKYVKELRDSCIKFKNSVDTEI